MIKKYSLVCCIMLTLLSAHAQTITFTFDTAYTINNGQKRTFQQTVDGVTCNASFHAENYLDEGLPAGDTNELDDSNLINHHGLWMGCYQQASANERILFSRPGASITFSHDVRLKSYTLGKIPEDNGNATYCFLRGGNVTALAGHEGPEYGGERPFDLECVVSAGTPLLSCTRREEGTNRREWRIKTLTVELEDYVEPVISIPEGNETGITRVRQATIEKISPVVFALKNGRLHSWSTIISFLSRDFIFDGGESGVLDFWISNHALNEKCLLIYTVEGYALFQYGTNFFYLHPLAGTLPDNADQLCISKGLEGPFCIALKDGFISFDGPSAASMRDLMPTELATGGVSEIASCDNTAMAVKDGKLYVWGEASPGALVVINKSIPDEITNGEVLHVAGYNSYAVAQLTTGEMIKWGYPTFNFTADQTSGELFADIDIENNNFIAYRHDGSFLLTDKKTGGSLGGRIKNGYVGPFYEEDTETPPGTNDFLLRGLEIPPTIVQQLGYEQIAFGHENAYALLSTGQLISWGGTDIDAQTTENPIPSDFIPAQINEIMFPQTNVAHLAQSAAPDAAELSMLEAGGLGIQWGASNTPYEVQTTTDILDDTSWESLPVDANNRFYRINPVPSN